MKLRTLTGWTGSRARMLAHSAFYVLAGASLAACGGGGGGAAPTETALVQSVAAAQVMEGTGAGAPQLAFVVTLDRAAVVGVDVTFSTAAGAAGLGAATGGATCAALNADYVNVTNSSIRIAAGASTGTLVVAACPDAVFEPNETVRVNWTSARAAGGGGTVQGTIVNDDAGGLNGTGASTSLGGVAAFGRDTNPLTNTNADGPLGFSFATTPGNCTLDNVTGLTWETLTGFNGTYAQAATYADNLVICGFSDWRVPTVNELLSLLDSSQATAVNADGALFGSTMTGNYWTSEERSPAVVSAFTVDIGAGGSTSYAAKGNMNSVRVVRGGTVYPACDAGRFSIVGETVTDTKTGLMWKQCHEGLSGAGACNVGTSLAFADVPAVVAQVNAANAAASAGHSDWRVPSKNELDSLADRSCPTPAAINTAVFPATDPVSYISGTLDAANAGLFWFVNFGDGSVAPATVAGKRLRLVRAGQ